MNAAATTRRPEMENQKSINFVERDNDVIVMFSV